MLLLPNYPSLINARLHYLYMDKRIESDIHYPWPELGTEEMHSKGLPPDDPIGANTLCGLPRAGGQQTYARGPTENDMWSCLRWLSLKAGALIADAGRVGVYSYEGLQTKVQKAWIGRKQIGRAHV